MNCARCRRQISAYVDDELPRPAADELREHLAKCAGCAQAAADLEALRENLRSLPRVTSHHTWQSIVDASRAERRPGIARLALAGVCVVVMLAGALIVRQAREASRSEVRNAEVSEAKQTDPELASSLPAKGASEEAGASTEAAVAAPEGAATRAPSRGGQMAARPGGRRTLQDAWPQTPDEQDDVVIARRPRERATTNPVSTAHETTPRTWSSGPQGDGTAAGTVAACVRLGGCGTNFRRFRRLGRFGRFEKIWGVFRSFSKV